MRQGSLPTASRFIGLNRSKAPNLMIIYGLGYATVYLIFVLLYWNALRQAQTLDLNRLRSLRHSTPP